jgi:integrase
VVHVNVRDRAGQLDRELELVVDLVDDAVEHPDHGVDELLRDAAGARQHSLEPVEVGRVLRAFEDEQARAMFLTLVLTGLRRFELLGLRWRDVDLVENVLRVRESKSEEGERSIALAPILVTALVEQLARSPYKGADELVFCHPTRGTKIDHEWFAGEFRTAPAAVGIEDYIRPYHDLRHASLTNGAAGGETPIALMATNQYVHRAGVVFRDEAAALERGLLGVDPVESSTRLSEPQPTGRDENGSTRRVEHG